MAANSAGDEYKPAWTLCNSNKTLGLQWILCQKWSIMRDIFRPLLSNTQSETQRLIYCHTWQKAAILTHPWPNDLTINIPSNDWDRFITLAISTKTLNDLHQNSRSKCIAKYVEMNVIKNVSTLTCSWKANTSLQAFSVKLVYNSSLSFHCNISVCCMHAVMWRIFSLWPTFQLQRENAVTSTSSRPCNIIILQKWCVTHHSFPPESMWEDLYTCYIHQHRTTTAWHEN